MASLILDGMPATAVCDSSRCRCRLPDAEATIEERVLYHARAAEGIVRATVVDTSAVDQRGRALAILQVHRWWQGDGSPAIAIGLHASGSGPASCDLVLKPGSTYLLYLQASPPGEPYLTTTKCSGSALATEQAVSDVSRVLGPGWLPD